MAAELINSRYEILESAPVSDSAALAVAKARDTTQDQVVTLETLPAARLRGGAEAVVAFRRAVQDAARLNHPGIVRVLDQGGTEETGGLFVVTEFVPGITLRERIRRVAPFSLAVAADIGAGIAGALDAAHRAGVAHGDLRPETILLGGDGQVKVKDWAYGQVAARLSPPSLDRLRAPYAAPEIGPDDAPSPAADVFALGASLFEMLTATPPDPGQTSPHTRNPGVPPALDGIVRKAMHPDPAARYRSAATLVSDLQEVREALRAGRPLSWTPAPESAAPPPVPPSPAQRAPRPSSEDLTFQSVALGGTAVGGLNAPEGRTVSGRTADNGAATAKPGALTAAAEELESERGRGRGAVPVAEVRLPRERERTTALSIAARLMFVAAVLGVIGLVWWGAQFLAVPTDMAVPNLIGKTYDDAARLAQQQNFTLVDNGSDYSDKWLENQIYEQDPPAGRTIKAGKEVTVKRSLGPRLLRVPNLLGVTQERAARDLRETNLPVGTLEENFSETVQKGIVVSQEPAADKMVPRNSTVNFVVSKGPQPPDPPADLAATASSSNQVQLTWKAAPRAQTYTILRDQDDGTTKTVAQGLTQTQVTDKGLKADSYYAYTVVAVNAAGKSAPSDPSPVTTLAVDTPPEIGPNVDVTPGDAAGDSAPPPDAAAPPDPAKMRQFTIEFRVPRRPRGERTVQFEVQDATGTNFVYDETRQSGDLIRAPITAFGNKITFRIYLDKKLVKQQTL